MKTYKAFYIIALMGTVLAGCQKEQVIDSPEESPSTEPKLVTLTVRVSKGINTRSLTLYYDDNNKLKLNATWADGEKVDVYLAGECIGTLKVTPTDNTGETATLSGKVNKTDDLMNGATLTLLFPGREDHAWSYQGQDGSAPSDQSALSTSYDYATATFTVASVNDEEVTVTGETSFETQQSIFCFNFMDKADNDLEISAKEVTFYSSVCNKLVQSRSYSTSNWASTYGSLLVKPLSATSQIYVSVRNENSSAEDKFVFSVIDTDNKLYFGTKTIPNNADVLGMGKFVSANVKLTVADMTPSTEVTTAAAL